MRKTLLWKIRGLNLLSFSLKKIIFFETFIRPFYGQSFIKTVQGPLKACMHFVCNVINFKEYVLNHFQNLRNGGKRHISRYFFLSQWINYLVINQGLLV